MVRKVLFMSKPAVKETDMPALSPEQINDIVSDLSTDVIDGHEADELFLVAIAGAAASEVEHLGSWRWDDFTITATAGAYDDGQSATGWHIRTRDGEFVEFVHAQ